MASKRQKILSRKNLAVAGWLLAALLLLAGLGAELMALVSAPAAAESPELRTARRNLRELEAATAGTSRPDGETPKLDRVLIGADGTPAAAVASGGAMAAESLEEEVYILPRLAGIVRIQNADGRVRYRAMLDGRDLGERERVDGFTVQRISPEGVVLAKAGRQWPLPAPDAALTVRQQ